MDRGTKQNFYTVFRKTLSPCNVNETDCFMPFLGKHCRRALQTEWTILEHFFNAYHTSTNFMIEQFQCLLYWSMRNDFM